MSYLVGNPKDRFSHDEAQMMKKTDNDDKEDFNDTDVDIDDFNENEKDVGVMMVR